MPEMLAAQLVQTHRRKIRERGINGAQPCRHRSRRKLSQLVRRYCIGDGKVTDSSAAKSGEMRTTSKRESNILGEYANVCAFAAAEGQLRYSPSKASTVSS